MSASVSPTYAEIMARSETLARRHPTAVSLREVGQSEEGRPIPMLTVGDATRDLPLMMILGGTHGSEETGRAAAMAFAEWAADEGSPHLCGLSAVVIPCVNPDGAEADSYHNARDVNLYHAYSYDGPSATAEGRSVEAVALDLLPDCCVDVHGLAGGAMGDSEFLIPTFGGNMGLQISYAVAAEIDAEAAMLGFPQRHPVVEGEFRSRAASICDKMATLTNAFCLTLEITENYYPLADSVCSAMARLTKLLDIGRRVHYNQPYPGFPCDTLCGGPIAALMPFGSTYRRRRENRLKTMAALLQEGTEFGRSHADPGRTATLTLQLAADLHQPPDGLVMQMALDPRADISQVRYRWGDGHEGALAEAGPEDESGYSVWLQDGIPMVRASVARPPVAGKNQVIVDYEAPYERHVCPDWLSAAGIL